MPIQLSDPIRRSQVRDGPPRAGAGGDVAELQGWGAGIIVACFFLSQLRVLSIVLGLVLLRLQLGYPRVNLSLPKFSFPS